MYYIINILYYVVLKLEHPRKDHSYYVICSVFPICKDTYKLISLGFPGGSAGEESACNEGDLGSIPGLGRSP